MCYEQSFISVSNFYDLNNRYNNKYVLYSKVSHDFELSIQIS